MKKALMVCLIISFIAVTVFAREPEEGKEDDARDSGFKISLGFRSYYSWWDPVWSRMKASKTYLLYDTIGQNLDIPNKADFLYNPLISLQFNKRWSLSGSYSYGHYNYRSSVYAVQDPGGTILLLKNKHDNDVQKHDADLLANYSINWWAKLIFGLKYQGYIINNKMRMYSSDGTIIPGSDNIRFHSGGCGIGMAFTVPLGADFYLFPAFSGIALVGKDFARPGNVLTAYIMSLIAGFDQKGYKTFIITGVTGSLAFAYHIKAIRLIIEAGARCQYLYYTEKPRSDINQDYDLFFGPFMGVTYSFM